MEFEKNMIDKVQNWRERHRDNKKQKDRNKYEKENQFNKKNEEKWKE